MLLIADPSGSLSVDDSNQQGVKLYFSDETQKTSQKLSEKWGNDVQEALKSNPDQKDRFSTVSDLDIKRLYTPEDLKDMNFARDIGVPGEYPYLLSARD